MISHHPTLNLDPDLTLDGVLYNHCRYFKFNVYVLFCFGLLWVLCPNQSFQSKGFACSGAPGSCFCLPLVLSIVESNQLTVWLLGTFRFKTINPNLLAALTLNSSVVIVRQQSCFQLHICVFQPGYHIHLFS